MCIFGSECGSKEMATLMLRSDGVVGREDYFHLYFVLFVLHAPFKQININSGPLDI